MVVETNTDSGGDQPSSPVVTSVEPSFEAASIESGAPIGKANDVPKAEERDEKSHTEEPHQNGHHTEQAKPEINVGASDQCVVGAKSENTTEDSAVMEQPELVPSVPEVVAEERTTEEDAVPSATSEQAPDVSTSPADPLKLPQFLYTAMEKVAQAEGFTPGAFKVEFDVGSNKGDGFVGQMFKAFLTEADRREVYLCKIPPLNEARRQQFQSMVIFERETLAYSTLLPIIFEYQQEKGVRREDGFFNIPKCYLAECDKTAEESVLVMEDLRLKDYRMWDKMVPVNYDHARLTMQHLGRLHAVSFALKRDRPEQFEQFKVKDPLEVLMPVGSPFEMMMKKMLGDAMETLEEHETKERAKIQGLIDNMHKEMQTCTDGSLAEPYAVFGHGDCWVNNFMFHYKNGSPEAIILLDWQISRYVTPVLDLAYFIFCCTDEEFRRNHYDEMMTIYYNSLSTLLEQLGHNPQEVFPRTALMRQLRRFGRFGILMSVFLVPMMSTRNEDLPDMDEAAERYRETNEMDENFEMKFDPVAYRKRMSAIIRDTIRYGYL